MGEWVSCPGCALKHSRRPDGLCPRCKRPLDDGAEQQELAAPPPQPELSDRAQPSGADLGSLAQAARGKELKGARTILVVVGILTIIGGGIFLGFITGMN